MVRPEPGGLRNPWRISLDRLDGDRRDRLPRSRDPGPPRAHTSGDHCDGRIRALLVPAEGVAHRDELTTLEALVGIGEDEAGELYALSLTQGVHRLDPAGAL